MPRRAARPLPKDLPIETVVHAMRAFLATDPPSPFDETGWTRFDGFMTDQVRIQGFDLSFFLSSMRWLVSEPSREGETDEEAASRLLGVLDRVHGDGDVTPWSQMIAIACWALAEMPAHVARWRRMPRVVEPLRRARSFAALRGQADQHA